MSQLKITNAGIKYKNDVFTGIEQLNITEMVFANVPNITAETEINAAVQMPTQHVVHTQPVHRVSALESDAIVISAILDYTVGNFDFNWFGAVATKQNGEKVLLAVVHTAKQTKTKTNAATTGDYTVKSIVWRSNNIVDSLNVELNTLPWQVDDAVFATQADKTALQSNINELNDQLTQVPTQQKVPKANERGEIAEGWINIERTLTRLATALSSLQLERLTKKNEVAALQTEVAKLTRAVKPLQLAAPSSVGAASLALADEITKIEQATQQQSTKLDNLQKAQTNQSIELKTSMQIVSGLMLDLEHANALLKQTSDAAQQTQYNASELDKKARQASAHAQRVDEKAKLTAQAHEEVTVKVKQVQASSKNAELKAKAASVQAAATSVLALVTELESQTIAQNAQSAQQNADDAAQHNQQVQVSAHTVAETKSLIVDIKSQIEQLTEAAQTASADSVTAQADVNTKAQQVQQAHDATQAAAQNAQLDKQRAQEAASTAVKVTTDFAATTLPEQGKTPVATGETGEIDEGWINIERTLTRLATALASLHTKQFNNTRTVTTLNEQVADIKQQLIDLSQLMQNAKLDHHQVDETLFTGVRPKTGSHTLPVFNMTERGWLADASYQEGIAEFTRMLGGSGILGTRQYQADRGFKPGHRVIDASYACLNIHNHANYAAMPGMAEISATINGYYFRTRHNDYRLMHAVQGEYLERVHNQAPPMPEQIKALPTGCNADGTLNLLNTQAGYMKTVKTENPQDCVWELSYLECWIETLQDDLNDPTDSFRHSNDGNKLKDIFDKGRFLNYSGHKNRLENLPYHPMKVAFVGEDGVPQFGILQFRISSYPVATLAPRTQSEAPKFSVGNAASHYHTLDVELTAQQITDLKSGTLPELIITTSNDFNHNHDVRVTYKNNAFIAEDLHPHHQHPVNVIYGNESQLPFDDAKANAGVIDDTNQFELVRDLRSLAKNYNSTERLAKSRMARYYVPDLERLCEMLPGLDGAGAVLTEEYTQYGLNDQLQNWHGQPLNAAYYNRRYRFNRGDASGRVAANRGFNDPTLFVAKTTQTKVVGGHSWMIPLELILRTPREAWNPYNCQYVERTELNTEDANGAGVTAENPLSGINERHFYFGTPKALIAEQVGQTDPADTANTAWVKGEDGTPRLLYGNGIRVHDVDGIRQRFPVYPVFQDYSHESNQQHWLRENIKTLLTKQLSGNLTITDIKELL